MGAPDVMHAVGSVALCSALGAAVVTDLRASRIPNVLPVVLLAVGLSCRAVLGGYHDFADGLAGAALAFLLFFPLWALRAMGAGDVKLLAACGGVLGAGLAWKAAVATVLVGGLCAVLYVGTSVVRQTGCRAAAALALHAPRQALTLFRGRFPYAIAIAAGVLYAWWLA